MCSSSEPVLGYGELVRDGIGRYEIESALAGDHLIRIRRGVYAVSDAYDDVVAAAAHGEPLAVFLPPGILVSSPFPEPRNGTPV